MSNNTATICSWQKVIWKCSKAKFDITSNCQEMLLPLGTLICLTSGFYFFLFWKQRNALIKWNPPEASVYKLNDQRCYGRNSVPKTDQINLFQPFFLLTRASEAPTQVYRVWLKYHCSKPVSQNRCKWNCSHKSFQDKTNTEL